MPIDHLQPTAASWRLPLRVTGMLLGIYGIGLIFAPSTFGSLFPWSLDQFHSQLYSAIFLTGCVMMLTVAKHATRAEFFATGMTEAAFGPFFHRWTGDCCPSGPQNRLVRNE